MVNLKILRLLRIGPICFENKANVFGQFFFFKKFFKVCLFGIFCLKKKKVSTIFLNTLKLNFFAKFLKNFKKNA